VLELFFIKKKNDHSLIVLCFMLSSLTLIVGKSYSARNGKRTPKPALNLRHPGPGPRNSRDGGEAEVEPR
jgi:hypothetical protein